MKIRIKFAKRGQMKFVGHLDIMRFFQKAIRRANIDISYSEGYSPHQKMSFAAPLGVGLESEGEYFDCELNSATSSSEMLKTLNDTMVEGIEVLSIKQLPDDSKKSMALVAAADYLVKFRNPDILPDGFNLSEAIEKFFNQDEIIIIKKTKKSEKETDIRPLIYKMYTQGNDVFMQLATGSANNLKPELVMEAFCKYICVALPPFGIMVTRLEVYAEGKNGYISLDDMGTEI